MHIPDGYLGPVTAAAGYAVMLPLWSIAARRVKKSLDTRQVPLLAIAAAFCFLIMMFNIPIPGGSSGHAVGGALAALLLGPWAAVIAVSSALTVQALLFGDGGITALGANCFNMAFVLPFAGAFVFWCLKGRAPLGSRRRAWAAAAAGYLGINLAALAAGAELGIQPWLHHAAAGQALYCPYGLKAAVGAMALGHLAVFGWVEAFVTGVVVSYLERNSGAIFAREAGRDA